MITFQKTVRVIKKKKKVSRVGKTGLAPIIRRNDGAVVHEGIDPS